MQTKRARHPPIFGRVREGDENRWRICVIRKHFPPTHPLRVTAFECRSHVTQEGGDMVTWLLMHEHALSHIMLYDDSRITMRDAQVHVALVQPAA